MVIAIGSVIVSYLIVKLAKGMKITFSVLNFRVLITFRKLVKGIRKAQTHLDVLVWVGYPLTFLNRLRLLVTNLFAKLNRLRLPGSDLFEKLNRLRLPGSNLFE